MLSCNIHVRDARYKQSSYTGCIVYSVDTASPTLQGQIDISLYKHCQRPICISVGYASTEKWSPTVVRQVGNYTPLLLNRTWQLQNGKDKKKI